MLPLYIRKSLLYLVSRALERQTGKPLLGMQCYSKQLTEQPAMTIHYSDGKDKKNASNSTSHGGFDNDVNTMNHIMTRILRKKPAKPFTENEMQGY